MIYCLTGKIVKKSLNAVVLSCGGVGYYTQCPASVAGALPGVGQQPGDRLEQRGLAAAVYPQQPDQLPGHRTEKLTPCSTAAVPYRTVRSCTQSPTGGGVVCGIMTHPSPATGSDKAETARPAAR